MSLPLSRISRALASASVGVALLGLAIASGCDSGPADGTVDYGCGEGLGGNDFEVTGLLDVDKFFETTLDFVSTMDTLTATLEQQLRELRLDLAIDDQADLGAEIEARLSAQAMVDIQAEPARCPVDPRPSVWTSWRCLLHAGCEIHSDCNPLRASYSCTGACEWPASALPTCPGNTRVACTSSGAAIACSGICKGSCAIEGSAACRGTCEGTCSGSCDGLSGSDIRCHGRCEGACSGICESDVGAACSGSCSGECTLEGGQQQCKADATARCEPAAGAASACEGTCEGDFTAPICGGTTQCDTGALCMATAKAEAVLQAECRLPTLQIGVVYPAGLSESGRADLDFTIRALKHRLPSILASLARAERVLEGIKDMEAVARGPYVRALEALSRDNIDPVVQFKLAECANGAFAEASDAMTVTSGRLSAQVAATSDLLTKLLDP